LENYPVFLWLLKLRAFANIYLFVNTRGLAPGSSGG
jgi:hypothetical protein